MTRDAGAANAYEDDMLLVSERLTLAPLRPEDADELLAVLADERLYTFIGGQPPTLEELRDRCRRLAAGSSQPNETWLNWTVRRRSDGHAVGTLQATIMEHAKGRTAYIAWVIGVPWQKHGFATEAARALVAWLHQHDVIDVVAHIHPDHQASAIVAARAGLEPTDDEEDGERVWRTPAEK